MNYEQPEWAELGDAGELTLGGEVYPAVDFLNNLRGKRK
jgi:hypothetical protein